MTRTRHKWHIFDLWHLSVTLTFDIVMGLVRNTPTQHGEHFHKVPWRYNNNLVIARTRHKLNIFDLWPLSVTLTFDIESWVLYATCLLIIINILTKLYDNAAITFEVTARTSSNGRTHGRTLKSGKLWRLLLMCVYCVHVNRAICLTHRKRARQLALTLANCFKLELS